MGQIRQVKIVLKVFTVFAICLLTLLVFIHHLNTSYYKGLKVQGVKLVVTYNTLWGLKDWFNDFRKQQTPPYCPYKCEYTNAKKLLYIADAVFFHGLSMDLLPVSNLLLKPRPPELYDQIWIFKLNESPDSYPDYDLLDYTNTFNWTMTYRRDSDIWAPNGQFKLKGHSRKPFGLPPVNLSRVSLQERKLAAAMVSNCNPVNQRIQYFNILKKYIPVDVYGKCGNLSCPKTKNCYENFGKKYKFFLAFENSMCSEYVTEKAFQPLRYGMVPVVRGGANYSSLFPKGSYINSLDFKTIQELSQYLEYLNHNDEEYRKYFQWRAVYEINSDHECEFCTKLHQFDPSAGRKTYSNIYKWYHSNYTDQHLCTRSRIPLT